MKKSKVKIAARVFLILTILFLLIFGGTFVAYQYVVGGEEFVGYLGDRMNALVGGFIYPIQHEGNIFSEKFAYYIIQSSFDAANPFDPLIFGIVVLSLAGLALILIVLGIVIVCKRKKGAYSLYAIAMLATLATEIILLTTWFEPYDEFMAFLNGAGHGVVNLILAIAILVGGVLGIIFAYITYFLGLAASKARPAAEAGTIIDDECPVLSDGEVPGEVNEEPVPEVVPEYIPVLEPEPEPEVVEEPVVEPVEDEEVVVPVEEPEVIEEPAPDAEPAPEVADEPKPEPAPAPAPAPTPIIVEGDEKGDDSHHVEVNVTNAGPAPAPAIDQNALASLLREVVRDIVRDEIARNNANQPKPAESAPRSGGDQHITGATFGGPLVVQYFNGGINGVNPGQVVSPAPEVVAEPKPEPAPAPAPAPEAAPAPFTPKAEAKPAPAPVPAPADAPKTEDKEKVVYERLTFAERLLQSEKELQDLYNELKNEILSYGVKSRVSANGDTFRLHKKMYVRITVAGKSLKLYFALNPDDYSDSKIPVQDAGHKGLYAEIPLVFKVRSGLSVRRCKELIQDVMEKDSLEQGEVGKVNWIKELKAELASGKKQSKDED